MPTSTKLRSLPVELEMKMKDQYVVRAEHCNHFAEPEEIYQTLKRITDPLTSSWDRIERARRIVIKFNMMHPNTARYKGRRQELVDEQVMRAVLRLLRERTKADLVAIDTCAHTAEKTVPPTFESSEVLSDFGVKVIDASAPPLRLYEVPGGGNMFKRYLLSSSIDESDEFISVAKMKNHLFMGITLCMKNLFGLPPLNRPEGRIRHYFHHAIRLSYVLPDLAMITDPCLNIIDGLVGQQGSEWGGRPVVPDALIAGNQTTATDACAMYLMGHEPTSDWPVSPFRRDRNHLLVAAERGYGTVNLDQIDFKSNLQPPIASFDSDQQDIPQTVVKIRRTACQQALYYRNEQENLAQRYKGQMIVLRDYEVIWHGTDQPAFQSHGNFATDSGPASALFLKMVDPDEAEGEVFNVYEKLLPGLIT